MIREYFNALGGSSSSGAPPPPPPSYNNVCITKTSETAGSNGFFRANAAYPVSQDTIVTFEINTSYNGNTESHVYSVNSPILTGNASALGSTKVRYTQGLDEQFTGIGSMTFSPAIDGGGSIFRNNGQCH